MNRSRIPKEDEPAEGREPGPASHAGRGRGARANAPLNARSTPAARLEAARALLDRGPSREAESQLSELIKTARGDARLLAHARCALAEARGRADSCAALLRKVTDLLEDSVADIAIAGEAQRLHSDKFGRRDIQITPQAVDLLMVNDWPGNVRQLCNELQRAVARAADGAVITPDQLSPGLRLISFASSESHARPGASSVELPSDLSLPEAVETLERNMIAEALRQNNGNVSRAARVLGLTRRGLQLKLGRYGIAATA